MNTTDDRLRRPRNATRALLALSLLLAPINGGVYFGWVLSDLASHSGTGASIGVFVLLALLQTLCGLAAFVAAIVYVVRLKRRDHSLGGAIGLAILGLLGAAGGAFGGLSGLALLVLGSGGGGAWGRPLRIHGRVRHPELRRGSDWTRGARPDTSGLDADTRAALEALWLHDAQKEHASVPAFARVAWTLTAVGAPAELLERTTTAMQEEIEHARLCFALAAGYGAGSHSVEPMPELLVSGLEQKGDAFTCLALESLNDGCLLEDYNADVAAACRDVCEEPVTRAVLDRVAREERSHAELSWSILAFCLERGGEPVRRACTQALGALGSIPRPTAVSPEKQALVSRADPLALRAHGRLPDAEWAAIHRARVAETEARLAGLLAAPRAEPVAA